MPSSDMFLSQMPKTLEAKAYIVPTTSTSDILATLVAQLLQMVKRGGAPKGPSEKGGIPSSVASGPYSISIFNHSFRVLA
jgi:hypothetical protein